MIKTRYPVPALVALALMGTDVSAQATLNALDETLSIDFFNTVPGVNNGPFDALNEAGASPAGEGQLDLNAWDYLADGSSGAAIGNAAAFPGTLPAGNGFNEGGDLSTGLNATQLAGQRALGIQPTGGHWSSGNITLRVVNNTGGTLEQLAITYTLGIFNDRDRSNSFSLYWSATNAQGSYTLVPGSTVISPLEADPAPEWSISTLDLVINGFSVPDEGEFFLRWVGEDVDGSGQRDEFAITDIGLTPQALSGPVVMASVNSLEVFVQILGAPSQPLSFTVSGLNLADELLLMADAPFEVSLNEDNGYGGSVAIEPVEGVVEQVPVFVRLNDLAVGTSSGSIAISSPGATGISVAVSGTTTSPDLPVLYINEILASNATGITDPNGEFDDWIEIFNPGNEPVDLAGWYISDDPANITRYQFPVGGTEAIVPANGWLLIWADNQSAQGDLHTNFALSASGESVILVAPDAVSVVDRVDFGPQQTDVSYGRSIDGGLPWVEFVVPTPGASNNLLGIARSQGAGALRAWPVPAEGSTLFLDRPVTGMVHDMAGRVMASVSRTSEVDITRLSLGSYLLRTSDGAVLRFVKQ